MVQGGNLMKDVASAVFGVICMVVIIVLMYLIAVGMIPVEKEAHNDTVQEYRRVNHVQR